MIYILRLIRKVELKIIWRIVKLLNKTFGKQNLTMFKEIRELHCTSF